MSHADANALDTSVDDRADGSLSTVLTAHNVSTLCALVQSDMSPLAVLMQSKLHLILLITVLPKTVHPRLLSYGPPIGCLQGGPSWVARRMLHVPTTHSIYCWRRLSRGMLS